MFGSITTKARSRTVPLLICATLLGIAMAALACAAPTPSPATPTTAPAATKPAATSPPAATQPAGAGTPSSGLSAIPIPPASAGNAATGKDLFTSKGCVACHTIGGGRLVGPDLKGVTTTRDHAWLIRFIVAPNQVIASGDPIATQLVQQYGTQMPNLGITPEQANDILAYIASQ
ncbi:MAG: cytochrome c [Chloroflexi bacterium]|nr:cytochrome c [Chloroflexota bacterium]MCL5026410.1 cytochrome c [Chloroflexota bacterium]